MYAAATKVKRNAADGLFTKPSRLKGKETGVQGVEEKKSNHRPWSTARGKTMIQHWGPLFLEPLAAGTLEPFYILLRLAPLLKG